MTIELAMAVALIVLGMVQLVLTAADDFADLAVSTSMAPRAL